MTKPYSDADFSDQIAADRSWRIKEISDLKTAAMRSDVSLRRVLLRSLIAICYAHWEGHVRFAARKYLGYVALRKLSYGDLDRQFLRNYFLPRLAGLSNSKTSVAERCALVDEILSSSNRRFSRVNTELIDTKSNLNFDVLSEICLVCNIPTTTFAEHENFVDVFLLKRRNGIAHGEETFVEIEDADELTETTVGLMRAFGDALENHIYLKAYRAPKDASAPSNIA
jgi:hypothetical protein